MSTENTVTMEQLQAQLAALQAENAALKHRKAAKDGRQVCANGLSMNVSQKGGLSVYGLGRFPVTLFASQWIKIIEACPEIAKYLQDNASKFSVKVKEEKQAA